MEMSLSIVIGSWRWKSMNYWQLEELVQALLKLRSCIPFLSSGKTIDHKWRLHPDKGLIFLSGKMMELATNPRLDIESHKIASVWMTLAETALTVDFKFFEVKCDVEQALSYESSILQSVGEKRFRELCHLYRRAGIIYDSAEMSDCIFDKNIFYLKKAREYAEKDGQMPREEIELAAMVKNLERKKKKFMKSN